MKNNETEDADVPVDKGFILGGVFGVIAGIIIFLLSGEIILSVLSALPIGLSLAISINRGLTGRSNRFNPMKVRLVLTVVTVGIILFISVALLVKLI